MADEPLVIRGINWRETFPFTNIFRAFRVAIHPSKLVLALLALITLYLGGRLLDAIWASKHRAVPGEIALYQKAPDARTFTEARTKAREDLINEYARTLSRVAREKVDANNAPLPGWADIRDNVEKARPAAAEGKYTSDAKYWGRWMAHERIHGRRDKDGKVIPGREGIVQEYEKELEDIKKREKKTEEDTRKAQEDVKKAEQRRDARIRDTYDDLNGGLRMVDSVKGDGLFEVFLRHQANQVGNVVNGVLSNNWLGGLTTDRDGPGVLASAVRFFTVAPGWALRHHPLYFLLFGILFLCVWSLFGGAIARIAAVHVADEGRKLSVRQGLSFATAKFLSFISAPMIPLIIIVVIGLVVAVGGLLLNIPYVGEVLVGALYFLALAAGFVMTLVLLGTVGGFNLMYPTIAVEGSDSFDAISRSFSYVYAKPWRMLFYSLVAIAYGALCYLFIKFFIWLMLLLTHYFTGLFVWRDAPSTAPYWPEMWAPPSLTSLIGGPDYNSLGTAGNIGSFLVKFWVYLTIAMLGAFAISFYFSVNTIIYYLMRREVDATEMDDVYLEQPEEDFAETPVSAPPATTTTTTAPAATGTGGTTTAGAPVVVTPSTPAGTDTASTPPPANPSDTPPNP